MQSGKKNTPENGSDKKAFHELSDHELLDIMITRTRTFLRAHGVHVLFALAVLLLIVVVVQTIVAKRQAADIKGHQVLSDQRPVSLLTTAYARPTPAVEQDRLDMMEQCRQIIEEHGSSSAAPWARMRLAQLLALRQEWEKAAAQYEAVIAGYENETLRNAARAGLASVREDLGEFEEAAALYAQVATSLPVYLVDAGRCYEMAGNLDGARAAYAELETADVPDSVKARAENRLKAIKRGGRYVYSPPPKVDIQISEPSPPDLSQFAPEETPIDTGAPEDTPADGSPAMPEDDLTDEPAE
jgi:predicted negative regulator of RcsB-dependent stress response